jgi:hypothetical protein
MDPDVNRKMIEEVANAFKQVEDSVVIGTDSDSGLKYGELKRVYSIKNGEIHTARGHRRRRDCGRLDWEIARASQWSVGGLTVGLGVRSDVTTSNAAPTPTLRILLLPPYRLGTCHVLKSPFADGSQCSRPLSHLTELSESS